MAMTSAFHAMVQLRGTEEGLMVDTGALDNLMSSGFYNRVKAVATVFGLSSTMSIMKRALGVEGVGKHAQTCTKQGTLPVGLEDGSQGEFIAPIIDGSEIPGILGLRRMEQQKAIIDTHGQKYIVPGPGGVEMKLSPGSKMYSLKKAMSGHLMLPITSYDRISNVANQSRSAW